MEGVVTPWSTLGASQDGSSPCDIGNSPDVWFLYTPEITGSARFRSHGFQAFDPVLSVYSFDESGQLALLACNDDDGVPGGQATIDSTVIGGRPYYLRVSGKAGSTGRFDLFITGTSPPGGVRPANGSQDTPLPIRPGVYLGYTRGGPGPLDNCFHFAEDAWFTYKPTASALAGFGTFSPYTVSDATISIEANGSMVFCAVHGGGLNVVAGTEYLIRVGTSGGASGVFALQVSGPPTAGGSCEDAEPIGEGSHLLTLVGSDASSSSSCSSAQPDQFFRYVATTDGTLNVSTCATSTAAIAGYAVDTELTLYSACPAGVATELECNKVSVSCAGGFRPQPFVSTAVTQGQEVFIRVSARAEGQLGPIQLDVALLSSLAMCFGDGTGAPCPCGNSGAPQRGCDNSLATGGARLYADGVAALFGDSLTLVSTDAPQTAPILLLQGDQARNGGSGAPFADGLLCVGGEMRRVVGALSAGGSRLFGAQAGQSLSALGGVTVPGTRWYQGYYRNVGSFCTGSPANLTNAVRVTWSLFP